jgi:hypothetical protein
MMRNEVRCRKRSVSGEASAFEGREVASDAGVVSKGRKAERPAVGDRSALD